MSEAEDSGLDPEPGSTPSEVDATSFLAFDRFFQARLEEQARANSEVATSDDYPDLLQAALASHQHEAVFAPGDFVQWKPMMRDQPLPLEAVPAVVVKVIETPATVSSDGDPILEPRDLAIGVIDGERVFRVHLVPSVRFTRWAPS